MLNREELERRLLLYGAVVDVHEVGVCQVAEVAKGFDRMFYPYVDGVPVTRNSSAWRGFTSLDEAVRAADGL